MKLTFIFTDSPDLSALSKYDIYRTHFEFPDEILELSDCEDRLLSIAQQVGHLTQSCLHITCTKMQWKNYIVQKPYQESVKPGIRYNWLIFVAAYSALPVYTRRTSWRYLKILAPTAIDSNWQMSLRQKRRKSLHYYLVAPAQLNISDATHSSIVGLASLANDILDLLSYDQFKDWRLSGINPLLKETRLIKDFNKRSKAREKEQRKQEREAKKRAEKVEKEKPKVGCVYFIQQGDDGPIKIGYSTNPQKRLQSLNTASPYPLQLLLVIPGGKKLERELHNQFAEHRLDGEWFNPSKSLMHYIDQQLKLQ